MDWAVIERWARETAAAIETWATQATTWLAAHPGTAMGAAACLMTLSALMFAVAAWRAARRAASRCDDAAVAGAGVESALAALRQDLAEREARTDATFERQRALTQDTLARLNQLESAVEQLRAEIIDQQTAKYRINEAIRQAMQR